jgi:hypothetical protein
MALTPEDMAQIAALIKATAPEAPPAAPEPVSPPAAPAEFYIWLADGRVLQSGDSASTMIDGVAVVARYPMSEADKTAAQEAEAQK